MSDASSVLSRFFRQNRIAQYLDIVAALILCGIAYWTSPSQALLVAGIAAILIPGRVITMSLVEERLSPIQLSIGEIEKIIDISGRTKINDIEVLLDAYNGIVDEEFARVKENIIGEATERLRLVLASKRSDELGRGDYYQWLLPILTRTEPHQNIRAVSIMADAEWDDSPEEERFIEGNKLAALRGSNVERIFIVREDQKDRFKALEQVKCHFSNSDPQKLIGHVIWYEDLQRRDSALLDAVGHGFIDFDGTVALVDSFSDSGEVRGFVTKNSADLKRLRETFQKLKNMSRQLADDSQDTQLPGFKNQKLLTPWSQDVLR